jgi:hypothetical protein
MIKSSDQGNTEFTWQSIVWRLFLTALLLIILAGAGVTIFSHVTDQPNTQVLPTLTGYELDSR